MLRSGDVIGARYRLLEPLASGGMGAVWRAMHTELSVEVALKVMLTELAATPSAEARFRREAQAAARLRSPHVVQVTDFGVSDGQPYLAMELLQGEDLQTRLQKRGRLPLAECATVLEGVAVAIELAHEAQIIHRDLKPANIFLAQSGAQEIVKVLDFGVAKVGGPGEPGKTTGAGLVGSPSYMSPEQVWAEPVTARSDVWSLAVVAYEMVTGKNPFDAPSLAKTFELIVRHDLPRVRDDLPDLPESVDAFFVRALERDPTRRFASAIELARAFREAIAGVTVTVPPQPAVLRSGRAVDPNAVTVVEQRPLAKRRVRVAAIAGTVALLGLGAYVVAAQSPTRHSDAAASNHATDTGASPATPSGDVELTPPRETAVTTASERLPSLPASTNSKPSASIGTSTTAPPKWTGQPAKTATAPSAQPSVHPKFGIPR